MGDTDSDAVIRDLVEVMASKAIEYLVETGFLPRHRCPATFYVVVEDDHRLSDSDFVAGASLDSDGIPYISVRMGLNLAYLDDIIRVIGHESIHVAQMIKEDLIPLSDFSVWRGDPYPNLAGNDPRYAEDQPWEKEAFELEEDLVAELMKIVNRYR